ncbi:hypothetical protein OESDEN_20715 [Oesophagostomum dentatum]|uniref:G-protein coupled receptors family 2 profile 2 domain-containing protein n=1 Tax=Oesophagostomum dentatum TaxID=61180 RepID=A0A0B1S2U3_OESDE|nr:hypothetical protein OESDEN_20715 [Oesophagostomum dentatum]
MLLMSSVLLTIFQALRLIASITINGKCVNLILAPPTAVTISLILPFTASLLLLILTNFFHRGDCFCWVRPDYIVYAVIIPTSVVILNAVVCTIIMCRKLFGNGGWSGAVRHHRIRTASRIGAVFVMQISLGMPWALQYLTLYSPSATIWHYVFTIVMGSQGTVLAVLFFFKRRQSTSFYRRSVVTRLTNVESSSETT